MLRLIHLINETHWEFLEVDDPGTVTYAILSHVWSRAGCVSGSSPEPTYEDLVNTKDFLSPTQKDPRFYKLREFCKTAWRHKYSFVWADMCCIQKSSSAELSEALTSMYYWYRCADICYAYLEDVQVCPNSKGHHPSHPENLPSSLWFERGWTLQELIAPRYLVFYSQNWSVIGSKYHLARYISSITRIPPEVLTHEKDVHTFSVASRMSWAAYRRTTRPEDRAYSLMGLFGVQIPVQYGEGSYAFIRLQEEILRRIPDPTLFAWGTALSYDSLPTPGVTHIVETNTELHVRNPFPSDSRQRHRYLLAASPDDFQYSGLGPGHSPEPEHSDAPGPIVIAPQRSQMRGGGPPSAAIDSFHVLRMVAPLASLSLSKPRDSQHFLAFLGCENARGEHLALLLSTGIPSKNRSYWVIGLPTQCHGLGAASLKDDRGDNCRLLAIPKHKLPAPGNKWTTTDAQVWETEPVELPVGQVFFPLGPPVHNEHADSPEEIDRAKCALRYTHESFEIQLSQWCKERIDIKSDGPRTFVLSARAPSSSQSVGPVSEEVGAAESPPSILRIRFGVCDPALRGDSEMPCPRFADPPPELRCHLACSIRVEGNSDSGSPAPWELQDHIGSWGVCHTTAVTTRRLVGDLSSLGHFISVRLRPARLPTDCSPRAIYALEIETSNFDPRAAADAIQNPFRRQLSTNDADCAMHDAVPGRNGATVTVTAEDPSSSSPESPRPRALPSEDNISLRNSIEGETRTSRVGCIVVGLAVGWWIFWQRSGR